MTLLWQQDVPSGGFSAELLAPIIQASPGHPGPEEVHVTNEHVLLGAQSVSYTHLRAHETVY